MKAILLLLSILFTAISLQASYQGDWTGWGTWKFKGDGDGMQCSTMQLTWSESESHVAIEKGLFECDLFALQLGKTSWILNNGKLFDEKNIEVGRYDGISLVVYMPSPNVNTTIQISVKRVANHIDYQEVWFNTQEKVYVIQGRLFTAQATSTWFALF